MNRMARFLTDCKPFGLWAGGLMWVVWIVSTVGGRGNLDLNEQVIGTDHSAFHTAAVMIAEGSGADVYDYPDLPAFKRRQEELTGKPDFLDPFRNPPLYAMLYVPTARLSYAAAYLVWAAIGLCLLIGGLRLIGGRPIGSCLLWSLSFYPVFAAISFGQNTLLSFAVFALVYHLLVRDRLFVAGIVAALLLYKPQLLLGFGVWWLLDCRRFVPCLAGLAIGGLVLAGLSVLIVPGETEIWLRRLPDIARYDAYDFYNLHNPRGFATLITDNRAIGNWVGVMGLCLTVVWLVRFWWRFHGDCSIMFVAVVFATLWGSPHTMTYEWALAIIPAIVLWNRRPALRPEWQWLFGVAWIVLFVSTPLAKAQLKLFDLAVQVSVPALAIVAIVSERALRRDAVA
jgi:hypothetical protein